MEFLINVPPPVQSFGKELDLSVWCTRQHTQRSGKELRVPDIRRNVPFAELNKTQSTAYHPEGNGQVENLHKTLQSMLKARVDDDPWGWDEQLDYCIMAFRSSVYSSTEHTPFELIFGREIRIPVAVQEKKGRKHGEKGCQGSSGCTSRREWSW